MVLNKKPLKELKISIAGIVISLESEQVNLGVHDNDPRQHFLTRAPSEVTLRVHYGPAPRYHTEEKVFDTLATWSLFRIDGGWVLKSPFKILILELDFKAGNIYYINSRQQAKNNTDFPLNYPLDELLMINLLSQGRGILTHSCGIDNNGKGMLFVGESGAGKSTLSNLWKDKKDAAVLSDDRIIIRKIDGRFWMYGTPWHGDAKACSPERAPLEKIFFLRHARENSVSKISEIDAVSKLIVCSFPTFWDKKGMEFTLGFIDELIREVPCYELEFVPDERVLDLVKSI
jgi:hypothetical protein